MIASDMRKIELEIVALSHSITQTHSYAVVLGEVNGLRRLPIVIGGFEAQAIADRVSDVAGDLGVRIGPQIDHADAQLTVPPRQAAAMRRRRDVLDELPGQGFQTAAVDHDILDNERLGLRGLPGLLRRRGQQKGGGQGGQHRGDSVTECGRSAQPES